MWSRGTALFAGLVSLTLGVVLALIGVTPLGSIGSRFVDAIAMGAVFWAAGTLLGFVVGFFLGALRKAPDLRVYFAIGVLFVGAVSFALQIMPTRIAYLLREDGVKTHGTVIQALPEDHNQIRYRYSTPSGEMTGWNQAPGRARDFSSGDRVEIYYARHRPEISRAGEPTETWASQIASALGGGLFVAMAAVILLHIYRSGGLPRPLP